MLVKLLLCPYSKYDEKLFEKVVKHLGHLYLSNFKNISQLRFLISFKNPIISRYRGPSTDALAVDFKQLFQITFCHIIICYIKGTSLHIKKFFFYF